MERMKTNMENEKSFVYSYSAKESSEVRSIREKYLPKEQNKLEILRRLDNTVTHAGVAESLVIGISGCLVFGVAMCMGLAVIPGGMLPAVIIGIVGSLIMLTAYPTRRALAKRKRSMLAPRILELANELEAGTKNQAG